MTFCAEPGCGVLVERGRCRDHARPTARARGYRYQWEQRSKAFRKRYPLCGMRPGGRPPVMSRCFDERRTTIAVQVDHVVPHKGDPRLFWDERGNWQSLCRECGARKSAAGL